MSVLARKRTLSELEFYRLAIILRRDMTFLLLKDLGVKSTIRNMRVNTKKMTELCGIAIYSEEELPVEMKEEDPIICVDSQKFGGNIKDLRIAGTIPAEDCR